MRRLLAAALLLAAAVSARAGDWDAEASAVGASPSELGIRAERFPTALTLPVVERYLDEPASGHARAREWGARLSSATTLSSSFAFAAELLGGATAPAAAPPAPAFSCPGLPAPLREPVAALAAAVERTRAAAAKASSVYTDAQRARLRAGFGGLARHEPLADVDEADAALAARFDAAATAAAASRLAAEAEARIPALEDAASSLKARVRCGSTLVSGRGDELYSAADVSGAALLVNLGRRSAYAAAPAAAGVGEAKLVVDLASNVAVDSSKPGLGSGDFGIGLFLAPVGGTKTLTLGEVSLGAGFFGAGGARLAGPAIVKSGDFSQGAAAFGAGVFSVFGDSSALAADYAAQGYGFTRGVGLFAARGRGVRADCGLVHPDPRESATAATSMCQGAGDGPRAYAAGGVGLALFQGDRARLRSSYFAQGAGYWHAFGGLYVDGDGASAQARRYAQGTGVHAGAGWLSWRGSRGRLVNWGVGPAFGWDYGVGFFELRGDDNALRADWASGEGDVNGRSLAVLSGTGNALRLNDWGAATFKRAAAGYALSRVEGTGNALWSPGLAGASTGTFEAMTAPWGVIRASGSLSLAPEVDVTSADWPSFDRAADAAAEAAAARPALARADELPPSERAASWLRLLATVSLDNQTESAAVQRLMALPPSQMGDVASRVGVEAFDEGLWARLALSAAGKPGAEAVARQLAAAAGPRRALLADLLRYGDPEAAVAAAARLAKAPDWRLRRAAAGALGAALGCEGGEEPGATRFLETSLLIAASTAPAALLPRIGVKRLPDLYAVLALDPGFSASDKLALLFAGEPFDAVKPAVEAQYARVLAAKASLYGAAIGQRLARLLALRPRAREIVGPLLSDRDADVRAGALASLGQLGGEADAETLGRALSDPAAVARDAAALGLARLGEAGRAQLLRRLDDRSPSVRRLAAVAAAQSADPAVARLLAAGFLDADAAVRLAAVSALGAVQTPYRDAVRAAAIPDLRRLASGDPSPSVRASALRLLGQIVPAPAR